MPSLSPERLAALVDEPPTPAEQVLLDASPALRAELAALRRVVALAAYDRTHPGPPLTSWASLAGALRDEGLTTSRRAPAGGAGGLDEGGHHAAAPFAPQGPVRSLDEARARRGVASSRRPWMQPWGMAAAAALLVVLGVAGGRASVASPPTLPLPPGTTYEPSVAATDPDGAPAPTLALPATLPARDLPSAAPRGASSRDGAGALPAGAIAVGARITDREQAVRTLQQLEEAHQQAVGWLAANDSSVGSARRIVSAETMVRDLRRQIEVLDAAVAMGRRALYESPDDPVMNRYYFSALAAREVLLRKLAAALPAGQQVLEY